MMMTSNDKSEDMKAIIDDKYNTLTMGFLYDHEDIVDWFQLARKFHVREQDVPEIFKLTKSNSILYGYDGDVKPIRDMTVKEYLIHIVVHSGYHTDSGPYPNNLTFKEILDTLDNESL